MDVKEELAKKASDTQKPKLRKNMSIAELIKAM